MKRYLLTVALTLVFTSAFASEGCYQAPSNCVSVSNPRWSSDNFSARYTNNCSERIYIRFCHEQKNGNWACGADGLPPGRSSGWDAYNATGRYKYNYVGSKHSSEDWSCAAMVSGWND